MSESQQRTLIPNLDLFDQHRNEIAQIIRSVAADWPRSIRSRLQRCSNWFSSNAAIQGCTQDKDTLAIGSSLAQTYALIQSENHDSASPPDIDSADLKLAVERGVHSIANDGNHDLKKLQPFIYPGILIIFSMIVVLLASFFIGPVFQKLYDSFGFSLPLITTMVLNSLALIRQGLWIVIVLVLLAVIAAFLIEVLPIRNHPFRLTQLFSGYQTRAIPWIQHLTYLVESGCAPATSIVITSNILGKPIASLLGFDYQKALENEELRPVETTTKFPIIHSALQLQDKQATADLLRTTLERYRNSAKNNEDWWVLLVTSWLAYSLIAIVCVSIFALFSPLFSVVSGLI